MSDQRLARLSSLTWLKPDHSSKVLSRGQACLIWGRGLAPGSSDNQIRYLYYGNKECTEICQWLHFPESGDRVYVALRKWLAHCSFWPAVSGSALHRPLLVEKVEVTSTHPTTGRSTTKAGLKVNGYLVTRRMVDDKIFYTGTTAPAAKVVTMLYSPQYQRNTSTGSSGRANDM